VIDQTAITSLNSINQLVFVMEMLCVFFVVGFGFSEKVCYLNELRASKG
jgi:hypothetical protein